MTPQGSRQVVEIQENVRGKNVVVIQSTCVPTNDNLMELMIMIDALKRASANRITAVIPYFGYARQDRRPRSARVAISARIVANMLQSVAGVERVLTMDLHADQIQGFFDIPVDNIYASPVLLGDLRAKNQADLTVVSPDIGGVVRARAFAKQLSCDLAITAYCTHPVLSGGAADRIANSQIDELVVTDTIPLNSDTLNVPKIRQLSIAPLLAETISRITKGDSVLSLFAD